MQANGIYRERHCASVCGDAPAARGGIRRKDGQNDDPAGIGWNEATANEYERVKIERFP